MVITRVDVCRVSEFAECLSALLIERVTALHGRFGDGGEYALAGRVDAAFTKVHLPDAWTLAKGKGAVCHGPQPRDRLTKPPVDVVRGSCFMYMRDAAHIQFATLREQSSTALLISDPAPAAKGCFRFCTPGQRMLPENLFIGEMHPQNASQRCSMRPKDGSKHGQGMLQVTYIVFSSFDLCPECLGAPKKRAALLPRELERILGGAGERGVCEEWRGGEREGPRKQSEGERRARGLSEAGDQDRRVGTVTEKNGHENR